MSSLDRELNKDRWEELECAFKSAIKEESFYFSQDNLPISYAFNMNALCDSKVPSKRQITKLSSVGYALRRRAVDCTLKYGHGPKQHDLCLKNLQNLYDF
jgi:hypothetical protein